MESVNHDSTPEKKSVEGAETGGQWQLHLYVAGQTPTSVTAFRNLEAICEEHLRGKYTIEVIDVLENPRLAAADQIVAIPTLVRKLPEPLRKIIGNLSNTERVLDRLDIRLASAAAAVERVRDADNNSPRDGTKAFERALADSTGAEYVLRLYVAGNTRASALAITNIRKICAERLAGRYKLEVIDLRQQPDLAREAQLVALPTLLRELPEPLRRIIGDLSNTDKVLVGLDLQRRKPDPKVDAAPRAGGDPT